MLGAAPPGAAPLAAGHVAKTEKRIGSYSGDGSGSYAEAAGASNRDATYTG